MSVELIVETPKGVCRPDDGNFNPYQLPCLKCATEGGVASKLCQKKAETRNPLIERFKRFILFPQNGH